MAVSDWSTTADENIEIDEINIGEHCPLRNINDAIRAIMAAVKANDANVVHKAGAETLAGVKTLTGDLVRKDTGYTKGTRPGSTRVRYIFFTADGSGTAATNRVGMLRSCSDTNGSTSLSLFVFKAVAGAGAAAGDYAELKVKILENGTAYAEAPTPAANDDSTKIATTEWVNGKMSAAAGASHTHGNITNDGKLGTASRAVVTDGNQKVAASSVTATELGYLSGVTSAIQTQLNSKAAKHTFSSTPVYTATLAEATTATASSPYTITAAQLGGSYQDLYIHMAVPAAEAAGTGRLQVTYANGAKKRGGVSNLVSTAVHYVSWRVRSDCGMADIEAASGSGQANVARFANTSAYDPIFCGGYAITELDFWISTTGVTQIPAGTVIRVFAAS